MPLTYLSGAFMQLLNRTERERGVEGAVGGNNWNNLCIMYIIIIIWMIRIGGSLYVCADNDTNNSNKVNT